MAGYGRIFSMARSNYRNLLSSRSGVLNAQPFVGIKMKVLDKLGIPLRPKKPLSPFFRYLMKHRNQIMADNPDMLPKHAIQKLAQLWAVCDESEKNRLQAEYDHEITGYTKKVMDWEQSVTAEHKELIAAEKKREQEKAQKSQLKRKVAMLGRPKRPLNAFLQFMQEKMEGKTKETTGKSSKEWLSTLGNVWRSMSDDEKLKYRVESQKLMEQYKNELKEWEEKMVRMGNLEVVRNRGLIHIKENIKSESK